MADVHFFDIRVAELFGVNCAVILQNIWHWVRKNEANGTNFYDGNYWTYNSTKAFAEQFPYLSQRQIETALKKLRDEGIIEVGNYNAMKYDRTLWYAVTEKGKCILHTGEMDVTEKGNGFAPGAEPIPDRTANRTAHRNTDIKSIVDYLNEKAETAYKPTTKKTRECICARLAEGFTVENFKTVIDKKCAEWIGDSKMERYVRPETLFGPKFESYLNEKVSKKGGQTDGTRVGIDGRDHEAHEKGVGWNRVL